MAKNLTRKQVLAGTLPIVAAAPLAKLAWPSAAHGERSATHLGHDQPHAGHAAMIGAEVPAPGGPRDQDAVTIPPPALPYKAGRVREYNLTAVDRRIEIAPGVFFEAWTYNGTVPGPIIRATEDDLLRVNLTNAGSHPHTIHFHGIHPADMDGVFEIVNPGESFTYEFPARPYGMQLYHCHATPLKKHIHKGLYGAFIIDPKKPRPPAQELVMVMNGYDTDGDGENNFYTVNGRSFFYAKYPIKVKKGELVRIYLANLTEFDLINSLHLHGDFFRYYPTGSTDHFEYTDTVMLCQGERGILEIEFANTGRFMFHAHQSEFAELGWMGFFEVERLRWNPGRSRRRLSGAHWRLWALLPIVALVGVVAIFVSTGSSLLELVGQNPPPADELDIRRVEFRPGEIKIKVTNPQRDDITIASVTVDDAIVPYSLDGDRTLERLRSATVVIPYDWVDGEPISVGVTSSSGIETSKEIPAAVETPQASAKGFLGYAVIGLLVGVLPVALGLAWLPSLRRASPEWLAAFMALTAGLLTFLAFEALSEAFELQAALPSAMGGVGLVLLGVSSTYLFLTLLSRRFAAGEGVVGGVALATLVAIGIGLHNLGEGLAIGASFALGELALGTFLVVGFMVHNVTEGLGIAAPIAERSKVSVGKLAALALIAGAPAIPGAWIGGFVTSDVLGVLFFAGAAGAAFEVVVEVGRYVARRAPGGLGSGYVLGGFIAGIAIMYVTGLLI